MPEECKKLKIDGIDALGLTYEEVEKEPVLKVIGDYSKLALFFDEEDKKEGEFLKDKLKILDEKIDTGIYDGSSIARAYRDVLYIYQRLLWLYMKNITEANKAIGELYKIVKKHYIKK